ncbi:hypothetical protein [Nonomuraea sp. NPDC003709]|uniref:hypothetical protein n=1 Tax=Nonomuraea sp. NPDC003709 TaxID=3154450 RepID=UPI0033A42BFD
MIDHYRNLFNRQQWFEDGLSWTVVQPLDEEITVGDLLWRLNGGRDPEERIMEYPIEKAGGGYTMLYAADGKIRARMRNFIFTRHAIQEGDPSILAEFRAMLDRLDPEDYRGKRSAAFAFIEASTGMGIEAEWLDVEEAPVIILDNWNET